MSSRRSRQSALIVLGAMAASWLGLNACGDDGSANRPHQQTTSNSDPINAAECVPNGELVTELAGEISGTLEWRSANLACEGMRRPNSEGARLRFSGPHIIDGEQKTLTFILGLPSLNVGTTGTELPTNVTLVEEGSGRFFATSDTSSCWTDVTHYELINSDLEDRYRITGELYCIAPLAEINGNSSVTFTELQFTGRVDWGQTE